jgi:hypothetical protein
LSAVRLVHIVLHVLPSNPAGSSYPRMRDHSNVSLFSLSQATPSGEFFTHLILAADDAQLHNRDNHQTQPDVWPGKLR